ncbi:hypothetical protein FIBSPDRAFT_956240 [Athelia psychrophila]|uniref:Uncharacterized protein n=1 Tax=Athelia psychrophila TaxID=1759441 RepID=A0A166H3P6_9AGAM|nr:hypothetical protein FIBSPDRAFT_956240 [Fibularhizoctonia sp. CBS 109695]
MEVNMVTSLLRLKSRSHKLVSISDGKLISKPILYEYFDPEKALPAPDCYHPQLMNTSSGSLVVRQGLPGLPQSMTRPFVFNVTSGWSGNDSDSESEYKEDKLRILC